MSPPHPTGRRRPLHRVLATAAATVLVVSAPVAAQPAAAAVPANVQGAGTYIVQLADDPVASYTGGVSGYQATKPAPGGKVDRNAPNVRRYSDHLAGRRKDVLAKVPGVKPSYSYQYTFNGFAAKLTATQAAKLTRTPGVVSVSRNEILRLDTVGTPDFLGLTGRGGVWNRQFGGDKRAGEGVIVGMVDSGYWPDNPSFAPLPEPRPDQAAIDAKWRGSCDAGEEAPVTCNNKVIGARYYGNDVTAIDDEFDSPRDYGGHGSHTASTVAGNADVPAVINGASVGKASGMAPAARIAVYKVCWSIDHAGGNSCGTSDSVAAIDQAVADGVDVINYSISGSRTSIVNPVEIAFYNAARAGVFVAVSAGNSGDTIGVSSVAHNAPWQTTVAASTHDRAWTKSVTLGNGKTYTGVGQGAAVPQAPLVYAGDVAKAGADPAEAKLCFIGSLDPAKVAGKIVACDRGNNARADKSKAVADAGGVGMVLMNPSASSLNADFHYVPTVHVDHTARTEILAYAQAGNATASLAAGVAGTARAPEMASFSSYGPSLAGGGDLLKPDITAPGVDVVAAVAPPGNGGKDFDAYSGTSMSSPHIAGLAALIISKNPGWSPMWVKSAMMTTATQTDNQRKPIMRGGNVATPLDYGAGHVVPGAAFDPGLVYDSGPADWIGYLCAIGQLDATQAPCTQVPTLDPSDMNYPSIAIGGVAGAQTVTRKVTNVTSKTEVYQARVQAPAGFKVKVSPSMLVMKPGQTATFKVTVTRTDAALDQYAFGALTWQGTRGHQVRSPIAVRPVALSGPTDITVSGASGSQQLALQSGYAGTLTAAVTGLVPAQVADVPLKNPNGESFDTSRPATNDHVGKVTIEVPAGTSVTRFATFDADYGTGTDLDLYVYRKTASGLTLVGSSGGPTAEESLDLSAPAAGTYEVYVDLYSLPAGQTAATIKHHTWSLGSTAAGNATATPDSQSVTTGAAATVTLSWQQLTAGTRYFGVVNYGDGSTTIARTVVRVDA